MRSGLLAVGVILLVLGAIFYFVPTPASAGTQEDSVTTTTYATNNDSWLQDTADNDSNTTNETNTSWTTTQSVTETDRVTTADRVNTADTDSDGNPIIYVYLDENGDMYSESGAYLGAGITTSDMTTTVGDRYGSARSNTADTTSGTTASATTDSTTDGTTMQWGTTDTQTGGAQDSGAERVNTADTSGVYAGDDVETNNTNASSTLFGDRDNTAAGGAGGVTGSNWIRTLSVLAMVLGAILAILGLILPSRDYDTADHRARTAGPAGRRVRYEREEEHEIRRR